MNKTKLLTGLVIALILLNIGVISFMLLKKPPHHKSRRGGPGKMIIRKLNFDEKQIDLFETLKNNHRSESKAIFKKISKNKNQLIGLLKTEDQSQRDSLIEEMGVLHKKLELLHFQHFADIKAICKSEQINDFNELVTEMGQFMGPPPMPPRRR